MFIPKTGPWDFIVPCESLKSQAYCPWELILALRRVGWWRPLACKCLGWLPDGATSVRGANKIGPKQTDPERSVQNRNSDKFLGKIFLKQ